MSPEEGPAGGAAEAIERRILSVYDELGVETVDLHLFFEMLPANTPADQAEVLAAVERLVRRGWLEERGNDFYARSKEGRQAASPRG